MEMPAPLRLGFVSLFPELLLAVLRESILGRAERENLVSYATANPRDFTTDNHRTVDDSPYGGGPGMLMKAEPVALAFESLSARPGATVIATDPAAPIFSQADANRLSQAGEVIFLCGHYEGVDERALEALATERFSIGDYVLTGGELPALVMADAIVRRLPGVLGNAESLEADSFSAGILSAPNYTRPENWRGREVPEVLRSGDHEKIRLYRLRRALELTARLRPDLLSNFQPQTKAERRALEEAREAAESEGGRLL
jgi:tRNA (guanine37-N1)-methyltransferase